MILKHLAAAAIVLSLVFLPAVGAAQAANPTSSAPGASSAPGQGGGSDGQQPHITIATPAPAPSPWPLQERISWVANLVLMVIAYVGIMFAVSMLRKIERQSRYSETAAQAAADSAKAILMLAQAQARSERPWLVCSAEPAPVAPDTFQVVVTNRGRSPGSIITLVDEVVIAPDEDNLPPKPVYREERQPPRIPIILLPGESATIKSFGRADVNAVCESAEQLRQVENWEAKVFLYGNIVYAELLSADQEIVHETGWCSWYIHGRQKSGMVMAGSHEYNLHT